MDDYWALVHHEQGSWGVSFPDVPGCVSAGSSLEEALDEGTEALSAHLAWLKAEGDDIPRARAHAALAADPEVQDAAREAIWHRIAPRPVAAPRQRVNIMIEPGLLRLVDGQAEATGKTRSALIEDALAHWTGRKAAADHVAERDRDRQRRRSRG